MSNQHRYLPIITHLIAEQRRLDEGDYVFARRLGISQPHWWRLKHGQRTLGVRGAYALVRAWPALADLLARIDYAERSDHREAAACLP